MAGLCDQGRAWSRSTYALFPISGALTALAGWFFYDGYFRRSPAEKERATTARLRLRLEPVVGPGLTALAATLQF